MKKIFELLVRSSFLLTVAMITGSGSSGLSGTQTNEVLGTGSGQSMHTSKLSPPQVWSTIDASSGLISRPFIISNDCICQFTNTPDLATAGWASYTFELEAETVYGIRVLVNNASGSSSNGVLLSVDYEPTGPHMMWDVPLTSGFQWLDVDWRGTGNPKEREYRKKKFSSLAGRHELIVRGCSANVSLRAFQVAKLPRPPIGLVLAGSGELSVEQMFEGLLDPDETERNRTMFNLRSTRLGDHVPQLMLALTNNDVCVRRFAAESLRNLKAEPEVHDAIPALARSLSDIDPAVRALSAACLGNIGPSASFAVDDLVGLLSDQFPTVRASASTALGRCGLDSEHAARSLASVVNDRNPIVRQSVFESLGMVHAEPEFRIVALVGAISDSTESEREAITKALAAIARRCQDRDATASQRSLEFALKTLRSLAATNSQDFEEIQRSVRHLSMLPPVFSQSDLIRQMVIFESEFPQELPRVGTAILNGESVSMVPANDNENAVYFLGQKAPLVKGLNWLEASRGAVYRRLSFFYEESRLKRFKLPYAHSYAIIAAIDDYSRAPGNDSSYGELFGMVNNAKKLAEVLESLGFPRNNILQFYNSDATSSSLNTALNLFWQRQDGLASDRLVFYFGGHGTTNGTSPCLVTWDFDPKKPALTGLLMSDLVSSVESN